MRRRASPDHGWWIVGLAVVAQLVTTGSTMYAYSIFFKPVSEEFGAGRLAASLGLPVLSLAGALYSPFVGRAVDRSGSRRSMGIGTVALSLGLLGIAAAPSLWLVGLLLAGAVALGSAMAGSLPSGALVVNWFTVQRARALGIATMGTSLGGVLLPPVIAALVASLGWRGALVCMAVAVPLVLLPAITWLAIDRPGDVGLGPDGQPAGPTQAAPDAATGTIRSTGALLRDRNFWLIAVSVGIVYSSNTALLVHMVPVATDAGFDARAGALLLSVIAACSFAGKVGYSAIGDRFDERAPLWAAAALQGPGWLALLAGGGYAWLVGAAAAIGLGSGAVLPAWNALVGRCFGRESFGSALGLMRPFLFPVMNLGAIAAGWVYDRSGSYAPAFQLFAALALLPALLPLAMRLPPDDATS